MVGYICMMYAGLAIKFLLFAERLIRSEEIALLENALVIGDCAKFSSAYHSSLFPLLVSVAITFGMVSWYYLIWL